MTRHATPKQRRFANRPNRQLFCQLLHVRRHMLTRSAALTSGLAGAFIGIVILAIVYAFADRWYATSISPLILLLTPGSFVGLLNPSSELYWLLVLVVQAV